MCHFPEIHETVHGRPFILVHLFDCYETKNFSSSEKKKKSLRRLKNEIWTCPHKLCQFMPCSSWSRRSLTVIYFFVSWQPRTFTASTQIYVNLFAYVLVLLNTASSYIETSQAICHVSWVAIVLSILTPNKWIRMQVLFLMLVTWCIFSVILCCFLHEVVTKTCSWKN